MKYEIILVGGKNTYPYKTEYRSQSDTGKLLPLHGTRRGVTRGTATERTRLMSNKAGRRNVAGMKAGKTKSVRSPDFGLNKNHRGICPMERGRIHTYDTTTSAGQKGADTMQKVITSPEEPIPCEQGSFTKRIGSTNYRVSVHFSKTSRETIDDKILRLVKNEAAKP